MEYAWRFYEKLVGIWVIESTRGVHRFPLAVKGLDSEGVARKYFYYLDLAVLALKDLFTVTAVEYPPGEAVMASPMPLDLYEAKYRLAEAWKKDMDGCEAWVPGALFRGLTDVTVQSGGKTVSAGLPDVLQVMLTGVPGSESYALAMATNCDIWLEQPISGGDNAAIGCINALKLKNAILKIEDMMGGRVVRYGSEFDSVKAAEHGFLP